MPPQVLGDYVLERRLGRGGFGAVWLGRHQETGARRALKVVPLEGDPDARARFQREGEAAARLEGHPAAVRIHACFLVGTQGVLVSEWVEGAEDLQARLSRGGPLEPRAAAALVRDLAGAVEHAHRAGVLHRDLKPGNVLLDPAGRPRLIDLGLARLVGERSLTTTGVVLGTPGYLAPEQALAEATDARTDVFGLGALLFACLTGQAPRSGGGALAVLHQAATEAIPSVQKLRPDCPPALAAVVAKACALDPAGRYPSPQAFADALEAALAGGGPLAAASRGALLAGGVAVLGALLALALALGPRGRDAPAPRPSAAPSPPAPVSAPAPLALALDRLHQASGPELGPAALALAEALKASPPAARAAADEVLVAALPEREAARLRWVARVGEREAPPDEEVAVAAADALEALAAAIGPAGTAALVRAREEGVAALAAGGVERLAKEARREDGDVGLIRQARLARALLRGAGGPAREAWVTCLDAAQRTLLDRVLPAEQVPGEGAALLRLEVARVFLLELGPYAPLQESLIGVPGDPRRRLESYRNLLLASSWRVEPDTDSLRALPPLWSQVPSRSIWLHLVVLLRDSPWDEPGGAARLAELVRATLLNEDAVDRPIDRSSDGWEACDVLVRRTCLRHLALACQGAPWFTAEERARLTDLAQVVLAASVPVGQVYRGDEHRAQVLHAAAELEVARASAVSAEPERRRALERALALRQWLYERQRQASDALLVWTEAMLAENWLALGRLEQAHGMANQVLSRALTSDGRRKEVEALQRWLPLAWWVRVCCTAEVGGRRAARWELDVGISKGISPREFFAQGRERFADLWILTAAEAAEAGLALDELRSRLALLASWGLGREALAALAGRLGAEAQPPLDAAPDPQAR